MIDSPFSLDAIFDDHTHILQHRRGYRFSVDALLLSWFVFQSLPRNANRALDLGAGSGVASILLARRGFGGRIDCVEREPSLFSLLEHNIARNDLASHLFPIYGDLRTLPLPAEHYDIVFFNPPFFPCPSCRLDKKSERVIARHELFGNLHDFLQCGAKALKKKGALCFVHPATRIVYACSAVVSAGLTITNIAMMSEYPSHPPSLCLYRCSHGAAHATHTKISYIFMHTSSGSISTIGQSILYADYSKVERNLKKGS